MLSCLMCESRVIALGWVHLQKELHSTLSVSVAETAITLWIAHDPLRVLLLLGQIPRANSTFYSPASCPLSIYALCFFFLARASAKNFKVAQSGVIDLVDVYLDLVWVVQVGLARI